MNHQHNLKLILSDISSMFFCLFVFVFVFLISHCYNHLKEHTVESMVGKDTDDLCVNSLISS